MVYRRCNAHCGQFGDVVLVGSIHFAGTLRVKEFLTRNGHPYSYIGLDRDDGAQPDCLLTIALGVLAATTLQLRRRYQCNPGGFHNRMSQDLILYEPAAGVTSKARWRR